MSYQSIDHNNGTATQIADPNMSAAIIALSERIESLKTDRMDVDPNSWDEHVIWCRIADLSVIYAELRISGDPDGTVAVIENKIHWIDKYETMDLKSINHRIEDLNQVKNVLTGQGD